MDKLKIYELLDSKGIEYEVYSHEPVFTAAQADSLGLPHPEAWCRNLFLRDRAKKHYYLLTVSEDHSIRIKDFEQKAGTKHLQFASREELKAYLGVETGSVGPFGLLNDTGCTVRAYIDLSLKGQLIAVHPNRNDATVFLETDKLICLLREHGSAVEYIDIGE